MKKWSNIHSDTGVKLLKVISETDGELSNTITDTPLLVNTPPFRRNGRMNRQSKNVTLNDHVDLERFIESLASRPLVENKYAISLPEPETKPSVPLDVAVRRRHCTHRRAQSQVDSMCNGDMVIASYPHSTVVYCAKEDNIREVDSDEDMFQVETESRINTPSEKEASPLIPLDHHESHLKRQLTSDKEAGDTPLQREMFARSAGNWKSSLDENTSTCMSFRNMQYAYRSATSPSSLTPYDEDKAPLKACEHLECEPTARHHHLFLPLYLLILLPVIILYWSEWRSL